MEKINKITGKITGFAVLGMFQLAWAIFTDIIYYRIALPNTYIV